jgi:catechol-2,3-dioxygenase
VLRPARDNRPHEPYAAGLHHLCLRVETQAQVNEVAHSLRERGIDASEAKSYPEYAHDYVACFISDPDGVRIEITNYREERRRRHDHWDDIDP